MRGAGADDDGSGPGAVLRRPGAQKNVLGTMMHSFFMMALVTVIWALFGYSSGLRRDR